MFIVDLNVNIINIKKQNALLYNMMYSARHQAYLKEKCVTCAPIVENSFTEFAVFFFQTCYLEYPSLLSRLCLHFFIF